MGDLDNDMDELFRKAADHYPLKTNGADWDKIMGKLPDAVGIPLPLAEPKNGGSNKKLLWLILLFPLGWLCNGYLNNKTNTEKNNPAANTTSIHKVNKPDSINTILQKTDHPTLADIKKIESNKQILPEKKYTPIDSRNNNKISSIDNSLQHLNNQVHAGKEPTLNKLTFTDLKNKNVAPNNGNSLTDTLNIVKTDNYNPSYINKTELKDTSVKQVAKLDKQSQTIPTVDTPNAGTKKTAPKNITKSKGFYLSAIGGFDRSSIKNQGIKKTGYSFGLLVGYNFNKHIAVETGLLWDKKEYYTDGQYFNKARTMIPSTVTILDMDGNCNMFELPIDLRYNVLQNKKSVFFGTAGISTYFMKKEYYGYQAVANGSQWYAMKTYNNSGTNLFSIVDVSIGYEHKIGKLASLRINPYLKIPIKGVGIGSLPITSSGINIGITYPFHK